MRCNKDCLNCKHSQCKYDLEGEESLSKPKKTASKPKNNVHGFVVKPKRGRPKKIREVPYWDEYYAKNGERIRARSRERYWQNREYYLEQSRKWREEHKDYFKERHKRLKEMKE